MLLKETQYVLFDAGCICKHCLSYRHALKFSYMTLQALKLSLSGGVLLSLLQNHRWLLNLWNNRCLCKTL
jgi:hypothetical protein